MSYNWHWYKTKLPQLHFQFLLCSERRLIGLLYFMTLLFWAQWFVARIHERVNSCWIKPLSLGVLDFNMPPADILYTRWKPRMITIPILSRRMTFYDRGLKLKLHCFDLLWICWPFVVYSKCSLYSNKFATNRKPATSACKLFNIRLYATLCFNYFRWYRHMFSHGSVFELLIC